MAWIASRSLRVRLRNPSSTQAMESNAPSFETTSWYARSSNSFSQIGQIATLSSWRGEPEVKLDQSRV
jgi:hypothetical protein